MAKYEVINTREIRTMHKHGTKGKIYWEEDKGPSPSWEKYTVSVYRDRSPLGYWNIPISLNNLRKSGEKYAEKMEVPRRYNRKFEEFSLLGEIMVVKKMARPSTRPYKVGDLVYFRTKYARGTKKWPDDIYPIYCGTIQKIDPATVVVNGYRVNHEYVLGRMSARKA